MFRRIPPQELRARTPSDKIGDRALLVLFICGLAVGLFLVVVGHGIASEYIDQGGGGLATLFGWGLAGLGYVTIGISTLAAGVPWGVRVIIAWVRSKREENSKEFSE